MMINFIKDCSVAIRFQCVLDETRKYMDSFCVLFFVFGMWFTGFPNHFPSLRVIQSFTTKTTFFGQKSCVIDYFNGSYTELHTSQTNRLVYATFLYANWDADSRHARSAIETLNSFSPIDITGINCWDPESSCNKRLHLTRYPQLQLYFKRPTQLYYGGSFSLPHLVDYFSFLLQPVVVSRSSFDLLRFLATHKFVVLGRFSLNQDVKTSGYDNFYHTALQFNSMHVDDSIPDLFPLGDVLFALDPTKPTELPHDLPLVTLYTPCNGSAHPINFNLSTILSRNGMKQQIIDSIEEARRSNLTCRYPTDITPSITKRSNLFQLVFSSSPVLLIVGPRLSLTKSNDPEGYLLHSLRLAYTACHSSPAAVSDQSAQTLRESLQRLHRAGIEADQRRVRLTAACPRWWSAVAPLLSVPSSAVCGPAVGADSRRQATGGNFTGDEFRQPIVKRIVELIRRRTTESNALLDLAVSLLTQIDTSVSDTAQPSHSSADGPFVVERLHFLCCHWFYGNHDVQGNPHAGRRHLLTAATAAAESPVACSSHNRSLQFHLLDSQRHPELAWRLAGHDGGDHLGAAIVDWPEESVYRLDKPVNYDTLSEFLTGFHNSSLKPWLKHPSHETASSGPEGHQPISANQPETVLSIRHASDLTDLLDMRTNIGSHRAHHRWRGSFSKDTNLVVYYYSPGCVYSVHGESLLLHFYAASRYLSNNSDLLFAMVDVSTVDLPWELRVERIPSVLLFPANGSSYSAVFSRADHLSDDVFYRLVTFILQHSIQFAATPSQKESPSAEQQQQPFSHSLKSFASELRHGTAARSDVLRDKLSAALLDCHRQSIGQQARLACRRTLRNTLLASSRGLQSTRSVALRALAHLEGLLNRINADLLHPYLRGRLEQLSVYSTVWKDLRSFVDRLDRLHAMHAKLITHVL